MTMMPSVGWAGHWLLSLGCNFYSTQLLQFALIVLLLHDLTFVTGVVTRCERTHCISFQFKLLWSERSGVSPLNACRFSCGLCVMPHLIDDYSMSYKCITLHMVPLKEFPWYWHAILLWYISQCRTQWEHTLWYPGYHTVTLSMITLIFNYTNREKTIECPVHNYNIIDSYNILQISDHVSLSCSWYVCCSVPARLKQTEPFQHHCLWYTCGTTEGRMISCSEKLNHCPLILAGQIHQVEHHLSAAW